MAGALGGWGGGDEAAKGLSGGFLGEGTLPLSEVQQRGGPARILGCIFLSSL